MTDEISPEDLVVTPTILLENGGGGGGGGGGVGGAGRGAGVPGAGDLGRRLVCAARRGDTALVLDLMAKGAPFTTDWLGTSALHVAARGAHRDTCAVLLRAGVSRDARTKVDRTALHLAADAGHEDVVALLLQNNAAVDCRDMLSMTPLHWAARRGRAAAAAALVAGGADLAARCKFGKTPRELALRAGHAPLVRLLDAARAAQATEAANSADALRRANESIAGDGAGTDTLHRLSESDGAKLAGGTADNNNTKGGGETAEAAAATAAETAAADAAASEAAAAMLRRHGITLLPHDEGSTVLTALQSGRSVVLSDAGKIMLKESGSQQKRAPPVVPASAGVLLTTTPARARAPLRPAAGVKIFTLNNNKLRALPGDNKIKFLQLPSERGLATPRTLALKAKSKLATSPALAAARPTVKIMMQKANFNKVIKTENGFEAGASAGAGGADVVLVPEEFLTNSSPTYLRAQLLAAHTTIAGLNRDLAAASARLAAAAASTPQTDQ